MQKLVTRGEIRKSDRVVVISTAHGLKFVDFKIRYHRDEIEDVAAGYANSPIELPARYDAVHDRMLREIERRL